MITVMTSVGAQSIFPPSGEYKLIFHDSQIHMCIYLRSETTMIILFSPQNLLSFTHSAAQRKQGLHKVVRFDEVDFQSTEIYETATRTNIIRFTVLINKQTHLCFLSLTPEF